MKINLNHTWLRASSCELGSRAGLVTRTNFFVCSYGKFQPGQPGWNSRNTTKMVEHKLVSLASATVLQTLVTLPVKIFHVLLEWKYTQDKNYAFWPLCCKSEAIFLKKVHPHHMGWSVLAWLLIWKHQYFYKGMSGKARSKKPSQPSWPGLYEESLNCFIN